MRALLQCRKALAATYPTVRKPRSRTRSPTVREVELIGRGYIDLTRCRDPKYVVDRAYCLLIRIRKIQFGIVSRHYVPEWLNEAYISDLTYAETRELSLSPKAQSVFMTQCRMERSAQENQFLLVTRRL